MLLYDKFYILQSVIRYIFIILVENNSLQLKNQREIETIGRSLSHTSHNTQRVCAVTVEAIGLCYK